MKFIIENWFVILALVSSIIIIDTFIYNFFKKPTSKQIESIKKWLLYAVTMAEKELGANTGQLKLHTVYDLFLNRFPCIAEVISFETFSLLVDEALDEMKKMLENNKTIEEIVKG